MQENICANEEDESNEKKTKLRSIIKRKNNKKKIETIEEDLYRIIRNKFYEA